MDDQNQYSDEQKYAIEHIKVESLDPEDASRFHQEIQTEPHMDETIQNENSASTWGVSKNKCKFCDEIFRDESSLKQHLGEYHLILDNCDGKPFKCKQTGCTRSFKIKRDLTQHVKLHTDKKPYHCKESQCLKSFKTRKNLLQHMKVHSGKKPFQCQHSECTKSFKLKGQLTAHLLSHSEAKPEKCLHPNCNKSFKTRYKLKLHMKYHSNVEFFKCDVIGCSKFLREKRNLKQHMAVHSNERIFKCQHQGCTKAYKNKAGLNKHIQTEEKKKMLGLDSSVRDHRDEILSEHGEKESTFLSETSLKQESDGDDDYQEQD